MLKKFKPYIAISLLVEAVSLVILFLILCRRKKGVAGALLAVAAISGAVGGYLFWQEYGEALGLKTTEGEDDGSIDFSDSELDIDSKDISSELCRDDEEADESAEIFTEIPSEESSESDFKGI